jgi:stage III sporulation protein SpoIIIAA
MEVPSPEAQHDVLLQAVQNHAPHVVIVDEVGSAKVGTQGTVCCVIFVPVRV